MEDVKGKETTERQEMVKTILIVSVSCIMGCIVGIVNTNKISIDSYKRGVYDTINAIIIR